MLLDVSRQSSAYRVGFALYTSAGILEIVQSKILVPRCM